MITSSYFGIILSKDNKDNSNDDVGDGHIEIV